MCSGRLQCRPKQDFEEPGRNNRSDHYGKLGFGITDRSNGRGNIIPAAVSNDRFYTSTPSSSKSAQGQSSALVSSCLRGVPAFKVEPDPAEMAERPVPETTVPEWRERLVC